MTQEGHERYTTEVIVDARGSMQMLDSRAVQEPQPQPAPVPAKTRSKARKPKAASEPAMADDDIPF